MLGRPMSWKHFVFDVYKEEEIMNFVCCIFVYIFNPVWNLTLETFMFCTSIFNEIGH